MKNESFHKLINAVEDALERFRGAAEESVCEAADLILRSEGKVVVTGVGKSGIIGHKTAATLASTGTPAVFLNAAEALHGDMGVVCRGDVVLLVSNSGETEELRLAITAVRGLGAKVIAITGNSESWLAKNAEAFLSAAVEKEGGGLGLAPRASVAAQTVVLASLSAELEVARNFNRQDFHARHPAGALGRETKT